MREMRWDCGHSGCWKDKNLLKLGVFDECFPGKIGFSDVDGVVEIDGNFLLLEWKYGDSILPEGQRIMFEKMTQDERWTVVIVNGNAESMEVSSVRVIAKGRMRQSEESSIGSLKLGCNVWASKLRDF